MILMGDEVRRTQHGNNNAYCHDDEDNWFDWTLVNRHADVHRFVGLLLERRLQRNRTHEQQRISLSEMLRTAKTAWHGVRLFQPDWSSHSHSIAFGAEMPRDGLDLHLILNAYWEPLEFELPRVERGDSWRRWIDTSLESPDDIVSWRNAPPVEDARPYRAGPRSVVVLWRSLDATTPPAG
jgi:glycogen operon protein